MREETLEPIVQLPDDFEEAEELDVDRAIEDNPPHEFCHPLKCFEMKMRL